jgi:hypothetical protein
MYLCWMHRVSLNTCIFTYSGSGWLHRVSLNTCIFTHSGSGWLHRVSLNTCIFTYSGSGWFELKHYSWRSWIRASWYNFENNQQDALYRLIYYSKSAQHVSGDVLAHHQEHLTVFKVSGSVYPSCCRLVPAATWVNTTRYFKYNQVLLMMG